MDAHHAAHHSRALPSALVRALVLSNMLADAAHPERGRFVRDQVSALRALGDANVELVVELYEFAPGGRALASAARTCTSATEASASTWCTPTSG